MGSLAWQPQYDRSTVVTSNPGKYSIGDDTEHEVMRKAYTWPNDPQVYGGDAPVYRIIFAPGGTSIPITPSVGQATGVSNSKRDPALQFPAGVLWL